MATADYGPDTVCYFVELRDRLEAAPHRERGRLIKAAANFRGVTPKTIYAQLRRIAGYRSDRKRRTDAGKSTLTYEQLEHVSWLIMTSTRRSGNKRLLSTRQAQEIAIANGIIEPEQRLHPSRLNELLREAKLDFKTLSAPPPHVRLATKHPNYMWQFDVSTCVLYYMRGALHCRDEAIFYKNKPDNEYAIRKQRVQRYLVTDHTSGAFFCRYYLAPGEDCQTLFDFLMEAFAEKPGMVMHGVPYWLSWDRGSANTSHSIKGLLDALDIRYSAHETGNPRAKGQVESTHNVVECAFEGLLSFHQATSIEDLNDALDSWQINFNKTEIHSRHGSTRYAVWNKIRDEQLRLAPDPELCKQLLESKPEPRTVNGNLEVSYVVKGHGSKRYSLAHIPDVSRNQKVLISVNPYQAPNIWVHGQDEQGRPMRHECTPIEYDDFAFPVDAPVFGERFASHPESHSERQQKARLQAAYGTSDKLEAKKLANSGVAAFDGIDPFLHLRNAYEPDYLRHNGTPHPIEVDHVEIKPLTLIQALKLIKPKLGRPLTERDSDRVLSWYPNGVPEEAIPEIVTRLTDQSLTGTGGS